MRWTNNKRHYLTAKHEPTEADITACDVLATVAVVGLLAIMFVACAVWVKVTI